MRTRTRLTTPPGQEPALSGDARPEAETYVPGPDLPEEPRVPGPRRRLWVGLAIVLVVGALGTTLYLLRTSGQSFDPALDRRFAPDQSASPDPGPAGGETPPADLPGDE